MLRRSTKIQLILFLVITLVGISYVSAEYVGLAKNVLGNDGCKVAADFPDSGGIFTNAEVTYRGVTVGKVGALHLISKGVRVDLQLDDCTDPRIPIKSTATVANRSVVGEQYVNLVPMAGSTRNGPFVHGSKVLLPMSRNTIPTPTKTLLVNLDNLVNSIPLDSLRTTISELDLAVNNRGSDIGRLLDASDTLLKAALEPQNVDNTIALINNSATVLQTQIDEQDPLKSYTHSLNLLSGQLKKSDPDIRRLLDDGPTDLNTVQAFIRNNRTDLGVVLSNLSVTGGQVVRHLDGVEQVLELYPALAAGGAVGAPGQGRGAARADPVDHAGAQHLQRGPAEQPQGLRRHHEGQGGLQRRETRRQEQAQSHRARRVGPVHRTDQQRHEHPRLGARPGRRPDQRVRWRLRLPAGGHRRTPSATPCRSRPPSATRPGSRC